MNTLAIDIGGTKFTLGLFQDGRLRERVWESTDRAGGPEWMLERISLATVEWKRRYAFERCGIGFGGPVDYANQRVVRSTHVAGWENFDLAGRIEQLTGVRPAVDNDANLGALGEALYGAGRGFRPLFYMTLSTGIGGGIVLDQRRMYRGADSYAGEIGHLTIRPDGNACAERGAVSNGCVAACGWSAITGDPRPTFCSIGPSCSATWWTWRW